MKRVFLSIASLILTISIFAQAPESFSYQAIVRDNNGQPLPNTAVTFQFNILQGSASGTIVYSEEHSATTNGFGLVNLQIGQGTVNSGNFSTIDWGNDSYFLNIQIDQGSGFVDMGTQQFISVPYALYAKSAGSSSVAGNTGDVQLNDNGSIGADPDLHWDFNGKKFMVGQSTDDGRMIIQQDPNASDSIPILEVKNKTGQTIFVVYPDSVHVFIDDVGSKGVLKGGFAVSGRSGTKAPIKDYLLVRPDSTRIYFDEGGTKGVLKGGFAVSGRSGTKSGTGNEYFNISPNDTASIISPSEARIMWYPKKNAFLAGQVLVNAADSVGTNSLSVGYETKAVGEYSQALGYKPMAIGTNSTAIGNYANANGINSYAFGNYAFTQDSGSYAIGSGAQAIGKYSFAIGSIGVDSAGNTTSPTMATGDYSYAFGMGSVASNWGAFAFGTQDSAIGNFSLAMGYQTVANGNEATTMGHNTIASGYTSTAMGFYTIASESYAVAMGKTTTASGKTSTAMGRLTTASGMQSIAMGDETTASGMSSTAMGWNTIASGQESTAMGSGNTASGKGAIAMGGGTSAIGEYSTAMGDHTTASVNYSTAMGYWTIAGGEISTAMGYQTTADGDYSTAMGSGTHASGDNSTAMGIGIEAQGTGSFGIGLNYNSDVIADNNTMAIMGGEVGIGTVSPDKLLHVAGDARVEGDIYYGASGSVTIYNKPDFVFTPEYNKNFDILSVEKFIKKHNHLPWLTAAKDEKDGVNMTRMSFQTLEAVENQQMQIIELKKENNKFKKDNIKQERQIKELLKRIEKLENQK